MNHFHLKCKKYLHNLSFVVEKEKHIKKSHLKKIKIKKTMFRPKILK